MNDELNRTFCKSCHLNLQTEKWFSQRRDDSYFKTCNHCLELQKKYRDKKHKQIIEQTPIIEDKPFIHPPPTTINNIPPLTKKPTQFAFHNKYSW